MSRGRSGRRQQPHERGEVDQVGRHLREGADRGSKVRAARVAVENVAAVFRRGVEDASGGGVAFVGEAFVGDALLHVVGFGGEDQQRLVLCLPAETSDGAVIAAGVEAAPNPGLERALDVAFRFETSVASGVFSTSPRPKVAWECGR